MDSALITQIHPQDPLVGRVLGGHYRITALLGRGGMSRVYEAMQAPLDRPVALKVLKDDPDDPSLQKRFLLEASVTSKLTHSNTIRIFDYGADQGLLYFAMELLHGLTVSEALKREGRFGEERTLHVARQICRSLREAHAKGLVHRDLKPSNLFLLDNETDFVKVLDFGLVKVFAQEDLSAQLTAGGLVLGTPHYMAPEQARGKPCDQRADIYSLGIVLYQMLSGRVPYDGPSTVDVHLRHATEAVPMLRFVCPDVSPQMESVVARCMAKKPEARFADMDEVLMALPGDRPNSNRPPPLSAADFEIDDAIGSPCADTSRLGAHGDTQQLSGPRRAISHSHPSMKRVSHAHPPPPPEDAFDEVQPLPARRSGLWIAVAAVAAVAAVGGTMWVRPWAKPVPAAVAAPLAMAPRPPPIVEKPAPVEPAPPPVQQAQPVQAKAIEAAPVEIKPERPEPPRKPVKVVMHDTRAPKKVAAAAPAPAAPSQETVEALAERLGRAVSGIRQCAMLAHAQSGTVSISVTVEPSGAITGVKLGQSGLGDKLQACIDSAVRRVKFDPFEGPPITLQRQVSLAAKQ